MRIAFSRPTHDEDTLLQLMEQFGPAGYDGLQLKMNQYIPWVNNLAGYLQRWGGEPQRASALIHFDALDRGGIQRLRQSIDFAAETSSERVVFCHNHPRQNVDKTQLQEFARTLSALGAEAATRGVGLSLHHHHEHPVMVREDFEIFFDAVDPGTVGLTVDTGHLAKSGIDDIPEFIKAFSEVIDNVHLKDYDNRAWRLLGEGRLDLDGILSALTLINYNGWLCVDEESGSDVKTGLARSREWLDLRLSRSRHPIEGTP